VKALFERWEEAKKPIKDLLDTISRQPEWHRIAFVGMGIPKLEQEAKKLDDIAQKLTKLDGEWLFAESYDPKRIQRAHGIVVSEEVTQSCGKRCCGNFTRRDYPSQRLLRRFVHGR
jgi:hypothetical protein